MADIDAIEASKENILPLATGRSASKLAGLLSRDKRAVDTELKQGHARFQRELETADADPECDDPLDSYHRYIRWTLQSYPSGPNHASQLVPLLEQTTRRFVKDARYKSDIRYLRLWILYSKYIDTPRDVYRFLEANDIGSGLASFYEEWAAVEEAANNNKEADAIYELGVARRAEPLARLKKRREAFQAKMVLLPPSASDSPEPVPPPRRVLAASTSARPLAAPVAKPNGASFAVLTDSGGSDGRSGTWDDLGTRDERRRENHLEATPWAGETLPMSQSKAVPQVEKLQVFRDEDTTPPPSTLSKSDSSCSIKSIRGPSEAESLRANPFKYYNADQIHLAISSRPASLTTPARREPVAAKPSAPKSSTTLKAKKSAPRAESDKRERVASPLAEVYPEDALGREEFSFEEICALRRGHYSRDGATQKAYWRTLSETEWLGEALRSGEPFQVDARGQAILYDENGRGMLAYIRRRQDAEQERLAAEQAAAAAEAEAARLAAIEAEEGRQAAEEEGALQQSIEQEALKRSVREPSPTINTKQALKDVGDLFGATMAFGSPANCSYRSSSSTEDEAVDSATESEDDDLPPASQNETPGDFVNDSFWGPVASQSQPWSQPSQAVSPLMDATDSESDTDLPTPPARPLQMLAVFQDENVTHVDMNVPVSSAQRKPLASRFAPLVDLMSPITEKTAEYRQSIINGNLMRLSVGAMSDQEPRQLVESAEDDSATDYSETLDEIKQRSLETTQQGSPFMSTQMANLSHGQRPPSPTAGLTIQKESSTSECGQSFPNPCQPQSDAILSILLGEDKALLQALPEYHFSPSVFNKFQLLQKTSKKRKTSNTTGATNEDGLILDLASGVCLSVREKLGEGGFGAVYRVANADVQDTSFGDDSLPTVFALKVTKPPTSWEFYALHILRERLAGTRALQSIITPYSIYEFRDEAHFLLEVVDQGTLLSAVNAPPTAGLSPLGGASGVDELLAIFFTIELLRLLATLHSHGFLHGDFKIDNVMVRLDEVPGGNKAWSAAYKADGSGGWSCKGVKLIDYGRSIDLRAFPANQTFAADFEVDGRDCFQMRQGRPWRFESDYHGLAGVAYTLLFGKHLEAENTVLSSSGVGLTLAGKPFRRYHQITMWTRLFAILLDPQSVEDAPAELKDVQLEMEAWLEQHSDKGGRPLKTLLRKLEIAQLAA